MASIPESVVSCSDVMCIGAGVSVDHEATEVRDGYAIHFPFDADVKCYYLIRGGFQLDPGVTEQEYIDHLAKHGHTAMWVDSESDARAMAMEMA